MDHYHHLSTRGRESILFMRGEGKGIRAIAAALGRAASTISRVLMYGKEANNQKQEIERQHHTIPNQRKQRLKGKALWKCA